MSQGYLSVSLSRYKKDFSALWCDFFLLTLSLCAFSLPHLSCIFSHSPVACYGLPSAQGFYSLCLFAKTCFFFLKSVRTVGGSLCALCNTVSGFPSWHWKYRWCDCPCCECWCRRTDRDLIMTAAMNPHGYRCNQVSGQNLIPCTFCNPVASCYAVVFRLKAKPGRVLELIARLLVYWWEQAGIQRVVRQ